MRKNAMGILASYTGLMNEVSLECLFTAWS